MVPRITRQQEVHTSVASDDPDFYSMPTLPEYTFTGNRSVPSLPSDPVEAFLRPAAMAWPLISMVGGAIPQYSPPPDSYFANLRMLLATAVLQDLRAPPAQQEQEQEQERLDEDELQG